MCLISRCEWIVVIGDRIPVHVRCVSAVMGLVDLFVVRRVVPVLTMCFVAVWTGAVLFADTIILQQSPTMRRKHSISKRREF